MIDVISKVQQAAESITRESDRQRTHNTDDEGAVDASTVHTVADTVIGVVESSTSVEVDEDLERTIDKGIDFGLEGLNYAADSVIDIDD